VRLRLPHYLDKRLIDGGKVVSPTRQPHFIPRFLYLFKDSWYSFLLEAKLIIPDSLSIYYEAFKEIKYHKLFPQFLVIH
jgi:hypothetical protein